jgi:hypothetical protein
MYIIYINYKYPVFGVLFIIPDSVTLMLFESAPPYHFPTCKHSPTYLAMT